MCAGTVLRLPGFLECTGECTCTQDIYYYVVTDNCRLKDLSGLSWTYLQAGLHESYNLKKVNQLIHICDIFRGFGNSSNTLIKLLII